MNRVNPLHIAALLIVILLFLSWKLTGVKSEIQAANKEFISSEALAVDLNALKSVYANPKRTKRALNKILSQRSLKSANLDIKRDKKSIKISSKSIDAAALNALMGKVLNGSYNITQLRIKQLSKEKAALQMEIKW